VDAKFLRRLTGRTMHCIDVIGLIEIVHHDFPVHRCDGGSGLIALPGLQIVGRPVVPDWPQKLPETGAIRIHVDPDKTGEGIAGYLCQAQLAAGIALGEIIRILNKVQLAVGGPCPAMIGADKTPYMALPFTDEALTAMLADVIERLYAAVGLSDH
jgi:hypothetical protein